jgi:hypothetical protein
MADQPDLIQRNDFWEPGWGLDPSKYLINPGRVISPGRHSPGQLAHARPYISNGSDFFVFPVGTEGFTAEGSATLGLHHYIGDNAVDGVAMHYEEGRITLTGTFPGLTSRDNMIDCRNMLRSIPLALGLILWAPGVFEREQFVLPESWNFTHAEDDRSHSIQYTITLVRLGDRTNVANPMGTPPPPQPAAKANPKGKPSRIFIVKSGAQTLQAIARAVYGSANNWQQLVVLNQSQLNAWKASHANIPSFQLPTFRWPLGTQFRY